MTMVVVVVVEVEVRLVVVVKVAFHTDGQAVQSDGFTVDKSTRPGLCQVRCGL